MKSLFICIMASATAAIAATTPYSTDFSTGYVTSSTANLGGQNGWVINDAPTAGPANPDQLSFLQPAGGETWGALGGYISFPNVRNVELSRPVMISMDGQSSLDLDFAIIESSATYNLQDSFGWTLRDASNNELFRIILEGIGPTGTRRISLSAAGGAPYLLSPSLGALTGTTAAPYSHHLHLDFANNGTDGLITGTMSGGNISATIPGQAFTQIASFVTDFDVNSATNPPTISSTGDNFIMFDNLVIIPEPSTTLVLGLAGVMGLARRRRSA